jgi:hypothetical protein
LTPLRKRMIDELRLRNLSPITARLYIGAAERFAKYYGRSPERLGPEQIRGFLLHLLDRKASVSTVQLYRSALRFLYVDTLHRKSFEEEIVPIKRHPRLPTVLSSKEITRILDRTIPSPFDALTSWPKSPRACCADPQSRWMARLEPGTSGKASRLIRSGHSETSARARPVNRAPTSNGAITARTKSLPIVLVPGSDAKFRC